MNTPNTSAPSMPLLGDPQFDQKARIYEAWQRTLNIAATASLRDAQQRAAKAAESLSALPQGPNPRRAEVLLLVSTMTSAKRAKPAAAVAEALAMLAALDAAGL